MDIFTWIQCFSSYVSVLAGHFADCSRDDSFSGDNYTGESGLLQLSLSEVGCLLLLPGSDYLLVVTNGPNSPFPMLYCLCGDSEEA